MASPSFPQSGTPPALLVRAATETGQPLELRFDTPFKIGRGEDCELRIQNEYVSRRQAEVLFENGRWVVRDLGSANGIFVGEQRISEMPISDFLTIRLGVQGPEVSFEVQKIVEQPVQSLDSTALYIERYFGQGTEGENAGERTIMVRRAFQHVQKKQKRKYGLMLSLLGLAVAAVGGYAFYQHRQIRQQTATAQEIFYTMKALDVDIANVEKLVRETQNRGGADQVAKYQSRRKEMEKSYDRFLTSLRVYDPKMTEEKRLILRMARIFGECELAMPDGFVQEVENYIKKWQSTPRLANAVERAEKNGYLPRITRELLSQNLPPQFFYLALQESGFDPFISGPPTKKGIAKGMWQFIPETGVKYGLRVGPLADFRRPDTADDRHSWEKATNAAARYLKDIYSTDAQASGLLVMASYNWGEERVIRQLRTMPSNPRERNFWRLLIDHRDKVPLETYDYVYHIFSASVIGENPKLFGFKFQSPMAHLEAQ